MAKHFLYDVTVSDHFPTQLREVHGESEVEDRKQQAIHSVQDAVCNMQYLEVMRR